MRFQLNLAARDGLLYIYVQAFKNGMLLPECPTVDPH